MVAKKKAAPKKKAMTAAAKKKAAATRALAALAHKHDKFCTEYLTNGENGTQAYLAAFPQITNKVTAASEAWKLLRNPQIVQKLREFRVIGHTSLVKSFEEIVQEVGNLAMFDPVNMFDEEGNLLRLHEMDAVTRKMVNEIEFNTIGDDDEDSFFKMVKVKYGKDKGKYLDMMMKFHNAFETHQRAGSGIINVQMYCAMDADL